MNQRSSTPPSRWDAFQFEMLVLGTLHFVALWVAVIVAAVADAQAPEGVAEDVDDPWTQAAVLVLRAPARFLPLEDWSSFLGFACLVANSAIWGACGAALVAAARALFSRRRPTSTPPPTPSPDPSSRRGTSR